MFSFTKNFSLKARTGREADGTLQHFFGFITAQAEIEADLITSVVEKVLVEQLRAYMVEQKDGLGEETIPWPLDSISIATILSSYVNGTRSTVSEETWKEVGDLLFALISKNPKIDAKAALSFSKPVAEGALSRYTDEMLPTIRTLVGKLEETDSVSQVLRAFDREEGRRERAKTRKLEAADALANFANSF